MAIVYNRNFIKYRNDGSYSCILFKYIINARIAFFLSFYILN